MKLLLAGALALACSDSEPDAPNTPPQVVVVEGVCGIAAGEVRDYVQNVGCHADFDALASEPLNASVPGATSVKVVFDRQGGNQLYFQNSKRFAIHYEFASKHLSGGDKPIVPLLAAFNTTEYSDPSRRFVLGAVTYYEEPNVWALEVAPYDTASPDMIAALYDAVRSHSYFGNALAFHPAGASESIAANLPKSVRQVTTEQLFAGTSYQPLNLGTVVGKLRFLKVADLEARSAYVDFQDVVVLDEVPNDIAVVSGLITERFQTPLSHVNVLAQNRKTPNMGLRGATSNPALRALEGRWVRFTVGAFEYSVQEATAEQAAADWELRKPKGVALPALDLSRRDLANIEDIVVEVAGEPLATSIKKGILAFGAKSAHYSVLARTPGVPVRKAFGIPIYYYVQFMEQNGLFTQLRQLLADPAFIQDAAVREARLREFRDAMQNGTVDAEFQRLLREKMEKEYPQLDMRFRTSTNSEDLDGFPCAGCYESHTGDYDDWEDVLDAVRETWASIWLFRTFEERRYHSIDHESVGMGLLVHHNFPDEEANGVALTANPYDPTGLEPAFYVNVQAGGQIEVVAPPPGITSDEFIYYFHQPNQPAIYVARSNWVTPEGSTVLTRRQIYDLGVALDAIHERFSPAYGPRAGNTGWYSMDVEFKFDDEGATPGDAKLYVKQARPHPGRGK